MDSTNRNLQKLTSYQQTQSKKERKVKRTFSEELKIKKVRMIDQGLIGVSELSRELEVTRSAIYKWMHKYSLNYSSPVQLVMESKSEAKKVELLKKELQAAYESIGRKDTELIFLKEMLQLASDHYGEDIAKKILSNNSSHLGKSQKDEH